MGAHVGAEEHARRIAVVREVDARGGSICDAAKLLGINRGSLWAYMERNFPDLKAAMHKQPRGSVADLHRRKLTCRKAAQEGRTMTEVSLQIGVRLPALSTWLAYADPETHAKLRGNSRGAQVASTEALRRLRLVAEYDVAKRPRFDAAAALGLSAPGLSRWLTRNAPWGAQDALDDFAQDE